MNVLNEKVSQQDKNVSDLGQSVNLLKEPLGDLALDVKTYTHYIDSFESRISVAEKSLYQPSLYRSATSNIPALNDITHEINITFLCAKNIFRGAPKID